MAWECKYCGYTKFYREQKVIYNKEGKLIDATNDDVICLECGERGETIKDIAEWEEE